MVHRQFDGRRFRSFAGITVDLSESWNEELSSLLSTATRRLRALQLNDSETAILKGLVLFCTGIGGSLLTVKY